MPSLLRHNRAHDYRHLMRRWRAVAREAGLVTRAFAEAGGEKIYYLRSRTRSDGPSLYMSAGIHGDEAASTEGLIAWAESALPKLRCGPVMIFPCLNPWGLINNSRHDADGRDLNRGYHDDTIPQVCAQKALLHGRRFDLALTLHEDYDAQGFYLYEVPGSRPFWGERLTEAVRPYLPIEPRPRIEGRAARDGIVRRAIQPNLMPTWPEAFVLAFSHSDRVFTLETPSEYSLDDRVQAHRAAIDEAVRLCREEFH